MVWPPAVWQLAEQFGSGDPRPVAKWPEELVMAALAFSDWQAIQHEKAREEATREAEINSARQEARRRSGQRPPVPKK